MRAADQLGLYLSCFAGYGPTIDCITARDRTIGNFMFGKIVIRIFRLFGRLRVARSGTTRTLRKRHVGATGRRRWGDWVQPRWRGFAGRPVRGQNGVGQAISLRPARSCVNDPFETSEVRRPSDGGPRFERLW